MGVRFVRPKGPDGDRFFSKSDVRSVSGGRDRWSKGTPKRRRPLLVVYLGVSERPQAARERVVQLLAGRRIAAARPGTDHGWIEERRQRDAYGA